MKLTTHQAIEEEIISLELLTSGMVDWETCERFAKRVHADMNEQLSELQQEIERLKEWISVEDRLPEVNMPVIAYTGTGRNIITWVDKGTMELDDQDINEDEYFTHWKPLPKPPKQQQ